ncbi:MAG: histidinol-phosphate transaminase [Bdellovibrionia bacterium]
MKVAPEILHLNPYVPGLPIDEVRRRYGVKNVYKLASNESALGPSPKAKDAMSKSIPEVFRYPDGACYELREAVSRYHGMNPSFLAFGNGSDDLFNLLIRAYAGPGDQILTAQYSFIAYKIAAQAARVVTVEAPVDSDSLSISLPRLADFWTPKVKIIFVANPNNPTGAYHSKDEVAELIRRFGGRDDVLLVFDEAYHEYVRAADYESALGLVEKYNNVVVLRTFSKVFGLAGLRLGVMFAQPEVISVINRIRQPFNVNLMVQEAAIAALSDREHTERAKLLAWAGLEYFQAELPKLEIPFWPTQGNFLLIDAQCDARKADQALLQKGIILRPLLNYGLVHHLRLSVGLPHENEAAIEALRDVLPEIQEGNS